MNNISSPSRERGVKASAEGHALSGTLGPGRPRTHEGSDPPSFAGPSTFVACDKKNRSCACDQALPPGKSSAYIITLVDKSLSECDHLWGCGLAARASIAGESSHTAGLSFVPTTHFISSRRARLYLPSKVRKLRHRGAGRGRRKVDGGWVPPS